MTESLEHRLLRDAQSLLLDWLPGGRAEARGYVCKDLYGGLGDGLIVSMVTGAWSDSATGQRGPDLLSLYCAIFRRSAGRARQDLWARYRAGDVDRVSPFGPSRRVGGRRTLLRVSEDLADHIRKARGEDTIDAYLRRALGLAPVVRWPYRRMAVGETVEHDTHLVGWDEAAQKLALLYAKRGGKRFERVVEGHMCRVTRSR